MDAPNDTVRGGFGAVSDELNLPPAQPPISLDRARRYFTESSTATQKADRLAVRDIEYYHGKQLSPEVLQKLKERGQAPVYINRIKPGIDGLFGIADAAETVPECLPRNPNDQDNADLSTKVLRYLADAAGLERVRRQYTQDYFIPGIGAVIVGDEAQTGDKEFKVRHIAWADFFYDPASLDHDFFDATYLGQAKWFDADVLSTKYPDIVGPSALTFNDFFNDKTAFYKQLWLDPERRRVRVIELYYKDEYGVWQRVLFYHGGILEFGKSVYKNDKGETICPIIAETYEINPLTGERYGAIRNMIPVQDEINSRRSSLLNFTQNRKVKQVEQGVDPTQKEVARKEAAKANGVMPYGFESESSQDIAAGQSLLLQEAKEDLDRFAPTPAVLGRIQPGQSGRAYQMLNAAGQTEWSRAFGRLEALEERIYKHLWYCAKQFMTEQTAIRISGNAKAPQFVMVNVPEVKMVPQPVTDEQGQPMTNPVTGQPVMQMVAQTVNVHQEVAQMDMDVRVVCVPDTQSLELEVFQEIMRNSEGAGVPVGDPRFKLLLELAPLPNKNETIERYDAAMNELNQQNAQMAQMQQQMQQMKAQLDAMHIQAQAQKNVAQANKADAETAALQLQTQTQAHQQMEMEQLKQQLFPMQAIPPQPVNPYAPPIPPFQP